MPRGDGTGPAGQGPGTGRSTGVGRGQKIDRMDGQVAGPGGKCVCPKCGTKMVHEAGNPCYNIDCPKCGTKMVRE